MSDEIQDPREEKKEKWEEAQRDLARCFDRLFSTPDGKRVMTCLRAKFEHRIVFRDDDNGRFDPIRAALLEGQKSVIFSIEDLMNKK